ncbi:hypothetical protein EOS_15925 [Caballeronia mineralivorans PML1(12)]|uniref:Uncharacterized protein n=1 Tax=Caballeronia mineralivorans PML1(12) TaxID=908627 RepID=A0A0J1CXG9_9BURK|nr:hypothetical protein EOS_15925 [Caballeronia mineralivorans PML1(12)]
MRNQASARHAYAKGFYRDVDPTVHVSGETFAQLPNAVGPVQRFRGQVTVSSRSALLMPCGRRADQVEHARRLIQ